MQAQELAAALLGQVRQAGPVADLLYRTADAQTYQDPRVAPSAPIAAQLVEAAGVANAEHIVATLNDPAVLERIARKDNRKRIRRLIAGNPASNPATLEYLLRWGLRKDYETAEKVISRGVLLFDTVIGEIADAVEADTDQLAATNRGDGLSAEQVTRIVLGSTDPQAVKAAFAVRWPRLRSSLLSQLATHPVDWFSVTDALMAVEEVARPGMLGDVLRLSRRISTELLEWTLRLWPNADRFPWQYFVSYSGEPERHDRTADPAAVAKLKQLAANGDRRGQVLLATLAGVAPEDRLSLVNTGQRYLLQLLAYHFDLQPEVLDQIFDVSEAWPLDGTNLGRDQMRNPLGEKWVSHPLSRILSRRGKLTTAQAARLVRWCVSGRGAKPPFATLWPRTAELVDSELRLAMIRYGADFDSTNRWLTGELKPAASHGEAVALLTDPGEAFAHTRSTSGYSSRSERVVPTTPDELLSVLGSGSSRSRLYQQPWMRSVLDRIVRPLDRLTEFGPVYLWTLMGPLQTNPAAVETLLALAPTWEGTGPELVAALEALYPATPVAPANTELPLAA